MKFTEPVIILPLYPEERAALLGLLRRLNKDDWQRPTPCPGWAVKDIAAHLLADDLGLLSRLRDSYVCAPPYNPNIDWGDWRQLIEFINWQNEAWVLAARRLSPAVLIEMLEKSGHDVYQYFALLDPYALGEPVNWAGPEPAPVWLDIAREYTERWLHQQHIREAVGMPGLKERRLFYPLLDAFACALTHTFRDAQAPTGATVKLVISGNAGGEWTITRLEDEWQLSKKATSPLRGCSSQAANATVTIDQEIAWRLFTRGISKQEAQKNTRITGDHALGERVLDMVSILV